MNPLLIIGAFVCFPFLLLAIGLGMIKNQKTDRLRGYQDVVEGMSEQDMLSVMGGGYSISVLNGNTVKYEWRINGSTNTSGVLFKGAVYAHTEQTEAQRVIIYVRNGAVTEIDSNIPVYKNRFAGSSAAKLIPVMIVFVVGIYFCGKYIPMYTKPKGVQSQNHTSNVVKNRAGYTKELCRIELAEVDETDTWYELMFTDTHYSILHGVGNETRVADFDESKTEMCDKVFRLFEGAGKQVATGDEPFSVMYVYAIYDENGKDVYFSDYEMYEKEGGERCCTVSETDYNALLNAMQELCSVADTVGWTNNTVSLT